MNTNIFKDFIIFWFPFSYSSKERRIAKIHRLERAVDKIKIKQLHAEAKLHAAEAEHMFIQNYGEKQ